MDIDHQSTTKRRPSDGWKCLAHNCPRNRGNSNSNSKEHVERLGVGQQFYDDKKQFDEVYDDKFETHHLSFPGTRRGLRQVVRFGHLNVLSSIFKYHRVNRDEVAEFTKMNSADIKGLFSRKRDLREAIIEATKTESPNSSMLPALCDEYKLAAANTALHNFKVAGARLTDFSRVHQLMMRIVGRLTDYTLLWERDMNYLFLGLLYQEKLASQADIEVERVGESALVSAYQVAPTNCLRFGTISGDAAI